MSESFGFASRPDSCDHHGLWEAATIAGFGIQMCTGCGLSFSLMEHDGQLYWREVAVVTASDLAEALRAVRRDEDSAGGVQVQPVETGRPGQLLHGVPEGVRPGGAEDLPGVPEVPGAAHQDLPALPDDEAGGGLLPEQVPGERAECVVPGVRRGGQQEETA